MNRIFAAVVGLLCIALCCCFVCCSTDKLPEQDKVITRTDEYNVVSFNAKVTNPNDKGDKRWSVRAPLIAKYLTDAAPDIVCMQELAKSQYDDIVARLPQYTFFWYGRSSGSDPEGLAILWSNRFQLVRQDRFWLSETPSVPSLGWGSQYERLCVNVSLFDKNNDLTLNVFNVHLDNASKEAREKGIGLVVEQAKAADGETLICGDFNTTASSNCYKIVAAEFVDCQAAAKESCQGITFHNYGLGSGHKSAIDFVFCGKDFSVEKFAIVTDNSDEGKYLSDHYPVWAKLSKETTITIK